MAAADERVRTHQDVADAQKIIAVTSQDIIGQLTTQQHGLETNLAAMAMRLTQLEAELICNANSLVAQQLLVDDGAARLSVLQVPRYSYSVI